MANGLENLRRGADALREWDSPLHERLAFASSQFRAAYVSRDQWPESLRQHAEALLRKLLQLDGITDTTAAMPDDAVPELSSRLLEFFESAERLLADTDPNV